MSAEPLSATAKADQSSFLRALAHSQRQDVPYRHWLMQDILPAETAEALFSLPYEPPAGLEFSGRRETNNSTRSYFNAEAFALYPETKALADAFQSPEVVAAIEAATGTDLTNTSLRLEYCLDTDGFWLEPHTDIGVKQFTMLIYLSQGDGSEDWGTDVYDGMMNLCATAPCLFNSGLIFIPGMDTWHGFRPRTISGVRKSVIINYVGQEWRARHELAFPETPVRTAA